MAPADTAKSDAKLGAGAVERSCVQRISKVHDQHLAYVALEANLFSLGLPRSYLAINDPGANDSQIEVSLAGCRSKLCFAGCAA